MEAVIRSRGLAVLFSLAIFVAPPLFSQEFPVTDTPPMDAHRAGPQPAPRELLVITTPDGFDNFDLGVDSAEPHLAHDPSAPLRFFTAFNINRTHRTGNGHDWTFQAPSFGSGFTMRGDPVVAYDGLGNLYYENMFSNTAGGSIVGCKVMRSTDNGATWSASQTAISGFDKNWIACDQTDGPFANYVYTTMTATGGGTFARSTDQGQTWEQTNLLPYQTLPGMMVAVGPDVLNGNDISGGCMYVVTNSGPTANSVYTFWRSTDGGVAFDSMSSLNVAGYVGTLNSVGRLVINNARTRPYPFIAADNSRGPYRGRLYLVYAANDPPGNGNKPDIFLHYSTDQGNTWSSRVRVNDNPNPDLTNEWFPAIWCDITTGRLYIKWYDMRNDLTNQRAWVFGTYTDDGGQTFAPNQPVSNQDFIFPAPACAANTNCYRGDYDAITSNQHVALAVWTDFRNGNYGSFVGYFPDFAMLVSPSADTLYSTDSTSVSIRVPAVKLYTDVARFSASVTPAGNFEFIFPQGDSLVSFPDSLEMRINTNAVSPGVYAVTVTGEGPNGTPVHRRTIAVTVQNPPASVGVISPNGGENLRIGDDLIIMWSSSNLPGTVRIELSRNGGQTFPETLFASIPNTGSRVWSVTGPSAGAAKIRIVSVASPGINDVSDGVFGIFQSFVTVAEDWNLISVPVTVSNLHAATLFPSAMSPAYTHTPTGYEVRDTLSYGSGYWVKFQGSEAISLGGEPRDIDTILVPAGWSLLGSISYPVVVDSIIQVPSGILTNMYGYVPMVGYVTTPAAIMPGEAVWVKTSAGGQLVLRRTTSPQPVERTVYSMEPGRDE